MHSSTHIPSSILVVDDTPANLDLLVTILEEAGYEVRPVTSGTHALRAIRSHPPDLILLDITMPGMDGYETCRQLKQDPLRMDIPVLFISALGEAEDKVKAFEVGGVDYVCKPFQYAEVLARVRTHLELCRQKKVVEECLRRERELEALRDKLTHMIAHDMRTPLQAVRLCLELMKDNVLPSDAEILDGARTSIDTLVSMVTDMLDVSRLEEGALTAKKEPVELVGLVRKVLSTLKPFETTITVQLESPEAVLLEADPELVRRIIGNLLGNAYKFAPLKGRVTVRVTEASGEVRVEVSDNGRGIAPEHQQSIFEKFGQVEGDKKQLGTGLGLTFAKMAVEAHKGRIGVQSELGHGCTFWFTLPAIGTDSPSS